MGRIGSCVLRQCMSVELAPHCWNDTSLAVPEYVMDFRSPMAFCAAAMTAVASCAMAFPHREVRQIAMTESFFNTAFLLLTAGPICRRFAGAGDDRDVFTTESRRAAFQLRA